MYNLFLKAILFTCASALLGPDADENFSTFADRNFSIAD